MKACPYTNSKNRPYAMKYLKYCVNINIKMRVIYDLL